MMKSIRNTCLAAVGLSLAAAAGSFANDLPKISYKKFELPNGLRVVLSVDRSAPIVASFLHYHVGSKNERPDRTGFAHFFEHLMFEGTENIPRHRIDKIVQAAGGQLNAFTTADETGYQIMVPSNQLKLALWIESERMLHAKVEDIGVETQRDVVKEERKMRFENTPFGSLLENMFANAGAGTSYEWTPIGSAQYIDQARIEEFRDFYKEYYVPNNAVLSIVGDIDLDETENLVRQYFADIPRGGEIERPTFSWPMLTKEKVVEVREENTPLPALMYLYRTVENGDPDAYALEYLTTILATGNSSRLYREMVDEKQLAVAAQAFPFSLEMGGILGLFAVAHPTVSLDKLAAEFNNALAQIQKSGVTEEEFQKARNQIETQYARQYNSVLDKAQALATYETFFGDPGMINDEIDRYMAVTREDIQRVAAKYLKPENRVVLRYLPPGN